MHPPTRMKVFRGLIRHLDTGISEEEAKLELEDQGYEPQKLTRYVKRDGFVITTMEVQFNSGEELSRAEKEGVRMGYMRCEVVRKIEGEIFTQCFRCQGFGHIAARCTRAMKCVHCAGSHDSRSCPRQNELRCSNCGGDHSARDRRCPNHPLQARLEKVGRGVRSYADAAKANVPGQKNPAAEQVSSEPAARSARQQTAPVRQAAVQPQPRRTQPSSVIPEKRPDQEQQQEMSRPIGSVEIPAERRVEQLEDESEYWQDKFADLSSRFVDALTQLTLEKKYSSIRMIASVLGSSLLRARDKPEYESMTKKATDALRGATERRKRDDDDDGGGGSQSKRQQVRDEFLGDGPSLGGVQDPSDLSISDVFSALSDGESQNPT